MTSSPAVPSIVNTPNSKKDVTWKCTPGKAAVGDVDRDRLAGPQVPTLDVHGVGVAHGGRTAGRLRSR